MRKGALLVLKVCVLLLFAVTITYRHSLVVYWRSISGPVIDLIVAIGIGVLTAFLAILAGHVGTTRMPYRWMFWFGGTALASFFVIAGVRGYLATLRVVEPKDIVLDAVKKANDHTDEQIATVRQDLKNTADTVSNVVSDKMSRLGKQMETLKPSPPEFARLTFSFAPTALSSDIRLFPVLLQALRADSAGTFKVDFTARNISKVRATGVDVWIQICAVCSFLTEPAKFRKISGQDEHVRTLTFGDLNAGVLMEKMTAEVTLQGVFAYFDTSFTYGCANCVTLGSEKPTLKTIILH